MNMLQKLECWAHEPWYKLDKRTIMRGVYLLGFAGAYSIMLCGLTFLLLVIVAKLWLAFTP